MSQFTLEDIPKIAPESAEPLATPVTGIPQSNANPLLDVFGEPDYRDDHQKAMDTWRQESFTALDAAVIDPQSYGDERVPHGYTPDEWRKTRVVDDWMRLHTDGEDPPLGLSREFTRGRLAEQVFGGAGAENDDALYGEITKAATGRKQVRDLAAGLSTAARTSATVGDLGEKGGSFAAWRDVAKNQPGYNPEATADYYEAWHQTQRQAKDQLAPYKAELAQVWQAMKAGGAGSPSEVIKSLGADLLLGGGADGEDTVDEFQKKDAGALAYEAYAKLAEDERPAFLDGLSVLIQQFPKEERPALLATWGKQFGATVDSMGRGAVSRFTVEGLQRYIDNEAAATAGPFAASEEFIAAGKVRTDEGLARRNFMDAVRKMERDEYAPTQFYSDPSKDVFSTRTLEQGFYGSASAVASVAVMATPYIGYATLGLAMEDFAYADLRDNAVRSGSSEMDASRFANDNKTLAAVPQLGIEILQNNLALGKLPLANKVLMKLGDSIKNRLVRGVAKAGAVGAAETTVEEIQYLTPYLVQDLSAALEADTGISAAVWSNGNNGALDGFWTRQATTFLSMLPLGAAAAAGGLNAEARQAAFARSSTTELEAFGIDPQGIAAIQGAPGPASLAAAIGSAMETRDPNSETAQAAVGALKLQLETQRRAQQNLENLGYAAPSFVQSTEGITVFDGEGKELGTAPDLSGAVRIARAHTVALDDMQADQVAALGSLMEAAKAAVALDPQSTLEVNLGAFDPETASPEMAARFAAQVALKEQAEGGTGDIARSVLGYSVTEMAQGVRQTVNRIFRGAAVTDVFHETFHGLRRQARAAGTITRADDLAMLRALDTVLAGKMTKDGVQLRFIPENMTDDQVSETLLDEAFSEIAEMEILRTRKKDGKGKLGLTRGVISRNLSALTKLIPGVAGKWSAFMQAVRARWGLSLSRAIAMKKAERDGTFDKQGYDTYLDKLLGLDQQTEHDAGVQSEFDRILGLPDEIADDDIPFSIGRATSKQDADYLAAVEAGDMATAQRLVDQAAKAAGYTVKAGHATPYSFTEFSRNMISRSDPDTSIRGFHFSTEPDEMASYVSGGQDRGVRGKIKIIHAFLKLGKIVARKEATAMVLDQLKKDPGYMTGDVADESTFPKGYDTVEFVKPWVLTEKKRADFKKNGEIREGNYTLKADPSDSDYTDLFHDGEYLTGYGDIDDAYSMFTEGHFIVKNADQIKSAEAITRDDSGKIIPLSQRFNPASDSIAFSIGRASVTPTAETRSFQGAAGSPSVIGPAAFSIGAFHGTPHQVDKFRLDKIGTGEGAQAYGWGLYFAESQAVAADYQKGLSGYIAVDGNVIHKNNRTVGTTGDSGLDDLLVGNMGDIDAAIKDAQDGLEDYIPKLEALRNRVDVSTNGNLYTVKLKVEDEELLDWDKPLSQQSESVQAAARQHFDRKGFNITAAMKMSGAEFYGYAVSSQQRNEDDAARQGSEYLFAAGIRGIRYLDGNSRADGEGSYNYVVFDEADIEILEENGTPVDLSAPAFSIGRTDRPLFSATNVQDLRHDKTAWLDGDASPAGANDIVSKYYKTAAFAGIPKDALLVAMPSTSGRNILPFALANRIFKDFGQAIEQRPVGTATAKGEAKNKRTFFDKEADPVAFVPNAEVIADLQGKRVFITEDVHNTGESWIAFARMLMDNGVQVLGVATLVSTEQRITSPRDIERLSEKVAAATGKGIDEVLPAMHSLFDGTFKQLFNKAEAEVSRSNTRRNAENSAKLFDIASSGRRAGAYSNPLQSGDGSGGEVLGGDGLSQDTFSFSLGGAKAGGFEKAKAEGRTFTGKDGKERFEMDASQAAFNPSAIKDPAHRNGFKRLGADSPIRWLVPEEEDTPLGNLIAFDELFENYPQLAGLKVRLKTLPTGTHGRFARVEINGKVSLEFSNIDLSDRLKAGAALNVLLHETQHAIQEFEGFAQGGSPEQFQEYDEAGLKRENDKYAAAMRALIEDYEAKGGTAKDAMQSDYGKALGDSLIKIQDALREPMRKYRALPGEKEARGVQARQSMTAEQRAATPFMDQWGSFSIGPAKVADIMAGNALKRITDPRRRTQVMSRIARDFGNMRLQIERMASLSGIRRSKGDLRREAMAREDLRAEELIADVHRRFGEIMADDDLVKIKSQPVHAALADPDTPLRGRLKSKAAAIREHPDMFQLHRAGDYDGSDGVSRSVFGGQRMPDQAAQELYDDGLIPEPTADALWEALLSEQKTVAGMKELLEKAKGQIREAKAQAKQEATEWLATQGKDQEVNFSDKEEIRRSLRMLDAILLALPAEIRGKIGGYTQISMIGTDEARLAYLKDKLAKADKELETFLRVEYAAEWEDLLRKAAPATNEAGQRPTGSIAADAYDIFRVAEAAMGMDFAAGEAEADKWDAIADHPDTEPKDVDMARVKAQMIRLTMNWPAADAARREQAVLEGEKIYYNGLLALKVEASRRRERLGKLRDSAVKGTGKTGHRMEREAAKQATATKLGAVKAMAWEFLSFGQVVNVLFGEKSAAAQWFNSREISASNAAHDGFQAKANALESLFDTLSGNRFDGEKLRHRMATDPRIKVKDVLGVDHTFTESQAITFLLMYRQEDGKRHLQGLMDEDGNILSEWAWDDQSAATLEAGLSAEGRAAMAFLGSSYGEEYGRINDVFRRIWNVSMPRHKMYAPLSVKPVQGKGDTIMDPVSGDTMGAGMTPGSLKNRSFSAIAEPDFKDAFQVYLTHARQMEHFIAYGEFARDSLAIINRRETRNAIEAAGGADAAGTLSKWVDYFALGGVHGAAMGGRWATILGGMLGRLSQAALVGRVSVLFMQSLQLAAASFKMPTGAFITRFAKLSAGRLQWAATIQSEYVQRRLQQLPPVVRDMMAGMASGTPNRAKYLAAAAGRSIAGADALFTAGTYAIFYDYHFGLARKAGIANPQAHAHAEAERLTDEVAQPTRTGARSWLEVANASNPAFRAAWNFSSDPRQKMSLLVYAAMRKDTTGTEKAADVAFTAAKLWIIGGVLSTLVRTVLRDLRNDDDDEIFDERYWSPARLALQVGTGPIGGAPFLGDMVEGATYKATGQFMPTGGMLSFFDQAAGLPKKWAGGKVEPIKDLETLTSAGAGLSGTSAAAASAMHLVRDVVGFIENLEGPD